MNDIQEAKKDLIDRWGEVNANKIIAECEKNPPLCITATQFFDYCLPYTDWVGKVLSGIEILRPQVWNLIPRDVGVNPYIALGALLTLCGVDGRHHPS